MADVPQIPPNLKGLLDGFAAYGRAKDVPLPRPSPLRPEAPMKGQSRMGDPAPAPAADPNQDYYWPDQSDIELSNQYDTLYGSPAAAYATPGAASTQSVPLDPIMDYYNKNVPLEPRITRSLNTPASADRLREQAIAAERSAVAKLGFDPSKGVRSPNSPEYLSVAGLYNPTKDSVWYHEKFPSAGIHESMHRGLHLLRRAGKLPYAIPLREEEQIVRALMQKIYGEVEAQEESRASGVRREDLKKGRSAAQRELGRQLKKHPMLDELEKVAAEEIAHKRPGGPR